MPVPSFAQQMVTTLQAKLLANAGVQSISIDGQMVTFQDLQKQLEYWKKKLAIENGSRPRTAQVYLGGF